MIFSRLIIFHATSSCLLLYTNISNVVFYPFEFLIRLIKILIVWCRILILKLLTVAVYQDDVRACIQKKQSEREEECLNKNSHPDEQNLSNIYIGFRSLLNIHSCDPLGFAKNLQKDMLLKFVCSFLVLIRFHLCILESPLTFFGFTDNLESDFYQILTKTFGFSSLDRTPESFKETKKQKKNV